MKEYGFMVHTVEINPDADDASSEEVSKAMAVGLNQILRKALKGLPAVRGGGWEIASHN